MKLITVEATFASSDLDTATGLFREQAGAVRSMAGCRRYVLYRKPSDDGIAIVQQWDTRDAFDAYRSSDTFAQLGKNLRPMMTTPPVTTIAEVDSI